MKMSTTHARERRGIPRHSQRGHFLQERRTFMMQVSTAHARERRHIPRWISCLPLLGLSSPPVPLQLKLLEELPVLQYHWYWHCWYDISARPQTVYQLLISTADKLARLGPSTHLESTTSSPRLHLELTNLKHANHRRHPYGVLGSGRHCVVCVQH
jgi:hypothetical protein